MSTRATYSFENERTGVTNTVYIHHDGYPKGAAQYMYDAIKQGSADFFFAFIRANERAEATESHDAHSDTEWRYVFYHQGTQVQVQSKSWNDDGEPEWNEYANCSIAEFIERELGIVLLNYKRGLHTAEEIIQSIADDLTSALRTAAMGSIGNASSAAGEIWRAIDAFDGLIDEQHLEQARRVCRGIADLIVAKSPQWDDVDLYISRVWAR